MSTSCTSFVFPSSSRSSVPSSTSSRLTDCFLSSPFTRFNSSATQIRFRRLCRYSIAPESSIRHGHGRFPRLLASVERVGHAEGSRVEVAASVRVSESLTARFTCGNSLALCPLAFARESAEHAFHVLGPETRRGAYETSISNSVVKDKIGDVSIKLQFGSDETWTRALRHVSLVVEGSVPQGRRVD